MTKQEVLERVLLERNAEKVEYTTPEQINAHKEYCDVLIDLLEDSIQREKLEKLDKKFTKFMLISYVVLLVFRVVSFVIDKKYGLEDDYE